MPFRIRVKSNDDNSLSGPRVSRRQSYGASAPPTSYDAPILPLSSSSSSSYSSPSSSSSSSYSSPSSSSSSSYDAGSSGGTSNSGGAFRPSTGGSSASSQAAQPIYGPVGDGELEAGENRGLIDAQSIKRQRQKQRQRQRQKTAHRWTHRGR